MRIFLGLYLEESPAPLIEPLRSSIAWLFDVQFMFVGDFAGCCWILLRFFIVGSGEMGGNLCLCFLVFISTAAQQKNWKDVIIFIYYKMSLDEQKLQRNCKNIIKSHFTIQTVFLASKWVLYEDNCRVRKVDENFMQIRISCFDHTNLWNFSSNLHHSLHA